MVIGDVAVESPNTWIVGIKGNTACSTFGHIDGVSQGPFQGHAINLKNLEFMAMQMHGMPHRSGIGEQHFHPLTLFNPVGIAIRIKTIIQSPRVSGSRSGEGDGNCVVSRARGQRPLGPKLPVLGEIKGTGPLIRLRLKIWDSKLWIAAQHNTTAKVAAFTKGQQRKHARCFGHLDAQRQALRQSKLEYATENRLHGIGIGAKQLTFEIAEVNKEAHEGATGNPADCNGFTRLNIDDLGIVESTFIGEQRVVNHIGSHHQHPWLQVPTEPLAAVIPLLTQ